MPPPAMATRSHAPSWLLPVTLISVLVASLLTDSGAPIRRRAQSRATLGVELQAGGVELRHGGRGGRLRRRGWCWRGCCGRLGRRCRGGGRLSGRIQLVDLQLGEVGEVSVRILLQEGFVIGGRRAVLDRIPILHFRHLRIDGRCRCSRRRGRGRRRGVLLDAQLGEGRRRRRSGTCSDSSDNRQPSCWS